MTYQLGVDNMSCQHCVRRVTAALERVPGVQVGAVAVGRATVETADDAAIARALAALAEAGYPARVDTSGGRP